MITMKFAISDDFARLEKSCRPKLWKFPAGESGAVLPTIDRGLCPPDTVDSVRFDLFFEGDHDLIQLCQLVDALKYDRLRGGDYRNVEKISLFIPYFPYSRQDRVTETGGSHALRAVARLINSLGFDKVVTLDAHSYALEGLVDNLLAIPQEVCAEKLPEFDILIAPDAGAMSKVRQHAQVKSGRAKVLYAIKVRDKDGKITDTQLPNANEVSGRRVCIVDDACDGGATFLELGKVVRSFDPAHMSLYVTHGLYTKGVGELCELFDHIYHVYRPRALEAVPLGEDGLPKVTVISDIVTSTSQGL